MYLPTYEYKKILGVVVADKCPIVVGKDAAKVLSLEDPELGTPGAIAAMAERPSLALLLKKLPDKEGNVIGKTYEYRTILSYFTRVRIV